MNINEIVTSTRMRNARLLDDINNKILNRKYYKFKYLPFEGALPGLYFQQQTEDAINEIGNIAYSSDEIAREAREIAQQAYNAAQAAIEMATNALTAAQNAQQTADTALNKANAAQSAADAAQSAADAAQTTANNALSAAANAQDTANNAVSIANTASSKADTAIEAAQNAQTSANDANARLDIVQPIVSELQWYNNITDAVNLNDYTELGRKYIQNTSSTNLPVPAEGWLDIDEDEKEASIRQMFITGSSGKKYVRFGTIVPDSDPTEVSAWTAWVEYAIKTDLDSTTTALTEKITTVANNLATHEADFNNPHKVTAAQLGLATVYKYKGSVETYANLPTSGQQVGDVYNVKQADPDHNIEAGDNVAWDGTTWDILAGDIDLSGYAQLNAANTFTAANTFNSNIVVRAATAAGSAGIITLGEKPSSKTAQCLINAAGNGNLILQASENGIVALRSGSVLQWSVASDEANTKTSAYLHSNLAATYTPATGVVWEGNANTATKLATARTINGVPFDGTQNITIEAGQGKFLPLTGGTVTGDVKVATRLYVGGQGGPGDGVISSDNGEKCLYFCGTAENTYYSTPNTGNTISYQQAANVYLINTSVNDAASLTMNFSNMSFHATVGSVPYMCKTLTFWFATGATAPTVTWQFPSGAAVYYPKGVAPSLTANASNIINVVAIVDDTDSFSIQVCDVAALPYSG